MADLMDRELFLALEGLRHQVVTVDVDRPQFAPAQRTKWILHGRRLAQKVASIQYGGVHPTVQGEGRSIVKLMNLIIHMV
jgi:hypothetical protein